MTAIPVIDLSRACHDDENDDDDDDAIQELVRAFETVGFATLIHHGIDAALMDRVFEASKAFFSLPLSVKSHYAFQGHESNRGYIPPGSETHDLEEHCLPDSKETFDIGKEEEEGFHNYWPTELANTDFRRDLIEYFQNMDQLYLRLMRMISMGLKLPDPDFLVNQCNEQHENLRLLRYQSLPPDHPNKMIRGNVHTDFGALTLLVQDDVGGLRVQNREGGWVNVEPVPHAIVVNVGDMLMRWSNDRLKATLHQVVTPSRFGPNDRIPERFSIAFFCNANKGATLECLETCQSDTTPAKYPPVNAHEYLTQRLSATIASQPT